MKNNLKKLLQKEMTRKNFLRLGAIFTISVIGIGGIISKLLAHAATPYVSEEAEGGTLGGAATIGSDTNASGGEYVKFGTAPGGSTGGSTPTPMISTYSNFTLLPLNAGDFEFAEMESSVGELPPGPWELTPNYQIMDTTDYPQSTTSQSLISIVKGVGLVISVGSQYEGTGIDSDPLTTPGGGFSCKAPYYREIQCTLAFSGGAIVNHPSSWTLTTRQGDDADPIDGEIDVTEGGYDGNYGTISNKGTLHNGPESANATSTYGPDMGPTQGSNTYGVYVTSTEVTWYLNGKQIAGSPGSGLGGNYNPAIFYYAIPTDTPWYPLHCIIPGDGLYDANSATVTGAAGAYTVAYDRWFVPG